MIFNGKWRFKCWFPAFPPFPAMFSRNFIFMVINACNCLARSLLLTKQSQLLMTLRKTAFENLVEKGENAGYQHFSFPYNVLYYIRNKVQFLSHIILWSASALNMDKSEILPFVSRFILSLFQTIETLPNRKFAETTLNLVKMAETSSNGQKTMWEKEKLLVRSNFSFSHSVFKRLVLQACKNQGLLGKGLF